MPLTMLRGDHSLGLGILNDEIGMFVNQHLFINYAYAMKLFGGRMAFGAQLGLLNAKFEPKATSYRIFVPAKQSPQGRYPSVAIDMFDKVSLL